MRVIRQFAQQVAERFQPEKIILFGSHAYGEPHADSDVDILVVMPARNELDQAARISLTIAPPFPLDIDVRTPKTMTWRLEEGDSFLREVVERGKVLYEEAGHALPRARDHQTASRIFPALGPTSAGHSPAIAGPEVTGGNGFGARYVPVARQANSAQMRPTPFLQARQAGRIGTAVRR